MSIILYESIDKELCLYFTNKGVNNIYWFREFDNLNNDIDPYDSNLTKNQKLRIIKECKQNPIYFFRKVLRLNRISCPDNPDDIVNFKVTKNTLAKIYLELYKNASVLDLDPKQSYKTITSLAIITYKYIFNSNEKIYIVAKYNEAAYDLNIIKRLISSLPSYIQNLVSDYEYKEKEMYNNYNHNMINIIRVEYSNSFSKYEKGSVKSNYYSYLTTRLGKATHILFDDLCFHKDFKYVYKNFEVIIGVHKPIVDITSCAFDTPFIKNKWKELLHWADFLYDYKDNNFSYKDKMILLHYNPDELFDKDKIIYLFKCLCGDNYDKESLKQFRYELCIMPFDSHFRIRTYIKKLGIKI